MADTTLKVRMTVARKTESEWSVTTTIPKENEVLYTKGGLHDGEYKIGDGTHRWSDLDYIKPSYTYPELEPLMTKTYNNIICTANSDPVGYLYFMTIKPDNYNTAWTIRYRVHATIAGVTGGYQDSEVLIEGTRNTYLVYNTYNAVNNTSYRPYYSHMYFAANETGQTNNYPHLLGFRFQSSYNPATTANSRTIVIEILEYKNCTPTFLDTMKLFADMPGSNSTNYGNTSSGANATRYSFDGVTQGWTFSGDRNTYPYLLSAYYTRPYAGVNGTKQYSLAMEDSVGRLQSFTTTHGTGTSKAKNTQGFRLGRMYYLNTSGNYTEGQQFGNDVSRVFHPDMDLRYSTNCGTTLTAFKPLYIVGTYNPSDGLFYLADTWWTQTLPTSEDGKIYIYIGCPYDTYRLTFEGYHDPVWYKNNAIRQFIPEATSAVGGAMSSADKTKLNGIATGAEVNQNTFAKVAVGSTTIEADAKQDTLTLTAGSNVTITPDATNDKVTIAATDTTYTFTNGLSASGTTVSNSGVRSIGTGSANGTISVNTNGTSADVSVKGLGSLAYASTVPVATSSAIGGVKSGGNITVASDGAVTVNNATYTQKLYRSSSDLTDETIDDFLESGYLKWARVANLDIGLGSKDGLVISIPWNNNYGMQLAFDDSLNQAWWRSKNNTTWNNWTRIVDKNYADTLYLPLIGGTLSNSLTISKAGECGLEVNNTQATNPNQVAFIVGSSGNGGIYSRKHNKWIVFADPNGGVFLQGNANTATTAIKAIQDESGNNIKASYAASFSISDHTITLKNKNGVSLGTVTVPDNNTTYSAGTGISLSGTTFSNSGVRSVATGSTNGTIAVNTNGTTSDVAIKGLQALAYKASLSKSDVGLGNVDNTSDLNKPLSTATQSALASKLSLTGGTVTGPTDFEDSVSIDDLNVGTMVVTGAVSFVNGINANQLTGSIPSALLPSYVDDVLEYNSSANFPSTGETGKIYVATNTNLIYRWSGSAYVEISPSLALGTTSSTAYRGDYGNTAYAHATDSSRLTTAKSSGFYKIATTAQGHVASVTAVTKGDLTALGVITGGSNAKSAVTISPTTTSVYSMTTDGAVTAGTANVPTKIDTTKFNAGSFTRGTFSQGTLPTLTFSIDANDSGNLKIGFSQGTLPTHAADSYTAPSLGSGFYTAGTANTPTAVTLPTRTQVSGLWNGYNTGVNNTFAAAQTFTGSTT